MSPTRSRTTSTHTHSGVGSPAASILLEPPVIISTPLPPTPLEMSALTVPQQEEEVDLVEQLYGANSNQYASYGQSAQVSPTAIDSIHNRSLDEIAWSTAAGKSSPLPVLTPSPSTLLPLSPGSATSSRQASSVGVSSLDDYSSRMRMAAIMLAQLSAAQQLSTASASLNTLSSLSLSTPVSVVTGLGGVVGAGLGAGLGAIWTRVGSSKVTATEGQPSSFANTRASLSTQTVSTAGADRQRVLSFTEATSIRNRIMQEMVQLEEERMARMSAGSRHKFNSRRGSRSGGEGLGRDGEGIEDEEVVRKAVNKDDPSGELWSGCDSFSMEFRLI